MTTACAGGAWIGNCSGWLTTSRVGLACARGPDSLRSAVGVRAAAGSGDRPSPGALGGRVWLVPATAAVSWGRPLGVRNGPGPNAGAGPAVTLEQAGPLGGSPPALHGLPQRGDLRSSKAHALPRCVARTGASISPAQGAARLPRGSRLVCAQGTTHSSAGLQGLNGPVSLAGSASSKGETRALRPVSRPLQQVAAGNAPKRSKTVRAYITLLCMKGRFYGKILTDRNGIE